MYPNSSDWVTVGVNDTLDKVVPPLYAHGKFGLVIATLCPTRLQGDEGGKQTDISQQSHELFSNFFDREIGSKVDKIERLVDESAPVVDALEREIGLDTVARRGQLLGGEILAVGPYGREEVDAGIETEQCILRAGIDHVFVVPIEEPLVERLGIFVEGVGIEAGVEIGVQLIELVQIFGYLREPLGITEEGDVEVGPVLFEGLDRGNNQRQLFFLWPM